MDYKNQDVNRRIAEICARYPNSAEGGRMLRAVLQGELGQAHSAEEGELIRKAIENAQPTRLIPPGGSYDPRY